MACHHLRFSGKPEEAIPVCKKAIRLEPFAPGTYYANLGMAYFQNGTDCEEAVKACEKGLKLAPEGMIDTHMGDHRLQRVRQGEGSTENGKGAPPDQPEIFGGGLYQKDPAKHQKDKDRIAEALRKAGL